MTSSSSKSCTCEDPSPVRMAACTAVPKATASSGKEFVRKHRQEPHHEDYACRTRCHGAPCGSCFFLLENPACRKPKLCFRSLRLKCVSPVVAFTSKMPSSTVSPGFPCWPRRSSAGDVALTASRGPSDPACDCRALTLQQCGVAA